jgi:hypothetical protein
LFVVLLVTRPLEVLPDLLSLAFFIYLYLILDGYLAGGFFSKRSRRPSLRLAQSSALDRAR